MHTYHPHAGRRAAHQPSPSRLGIGAALAVAAALLHIGPAAALTAPAVVETSTVDNDAVVQIASRTGVGHCTGVLVAPDLVLTAGHCMDGAVEGHLGGWSSTSPMWRNFTLPITGPSSGWTSGLRGSATMLFNQAILPYTYRNELAASPGQCRTLCEGQAACQGWTHNAFAATATPNCFLKRPTAMVSFGNLSGSPRAVVRAWSYSFAGPADIGMLKLETPVPATIARPVRVMTHVLDSSAENLAFLRAQRYLAVGFTSSNPTRRSVTMSFNEYPYAGTDLAMVGVLGTGGSVVEPGDSGSPLFVLRRQPDGTDQRYLAGINQGFGGGQSRYTLTGINLQRLGQIAVFPYDPASISPAVGSVLVGEWLNNVMVADHKARHRTLPMYQWWSSARGDNFATSDPRWADDPRGILPDATGLYIDPVREQNGDYKMFRLEGHLFDPKAPRPAGTVPLCSWFNPVRGDNFATSQAAWPCDPSRVIWSGESVTSGILRDGYTQTRVEGYLYDPTQPQPANTRPLFSWWSAARGDNFATTDPAWSVEMSTVRRVGDYIVDGPIRDGYVLFRLEGYVPITPIVR